MQRREAGTGGGIAAGWPASEARPPSPGATPRSSSFTVSLMLGVILIISRKLAALFNMVHPEDHYHLQTQVEGDCHTGGSRTSG